MKKIIVLIFVTFLFGFLLAITKKEKDILYNYFTDTEITYIKDNNIAFNELYPYLKFDTFNIYNYFDYQHYTDNGYNYYEAINLVNDPFYYSSYANIKSSIYVNTNAVLVNKHYYLDEDYIPNNLVSISEYDIEYIKRENETMKGVKESVEALERLFNEAKSQGISLVVYSSYRDYAKQTQLYYEVNLSDDSISARPGHSEHQSGLVYDISDLTHGLTLNFSYSLNYKWLKENAHLFGFIERYQENKEIFTLYSYEPWHYRYVGESIATYIYNNNLSLEEFILKSYEIPFQS